VSRRIAASVIAAVALASGCGRAGLERTADAAYSGGRFAEAYAAYAPLAKDEGGDLWLKAAAAARGAGRRDLAAAALESFGNTSPAHRAEAADGLEQVMAGADQARDPDGLRIALAAYQRLAPDRPVGRWVLALLRLAPIAPGEAIDWLPAALAAAPGRTEFDTLLLRYGAALEEAGNCGEALAAYESVIRRRADSARRWAATRGVARCGLALGATALRSDDAIAADRWFTRVAAVDPASGAGRRALVGLGDARLVQGDTIAAVIAWQRAADAGRRGDSIGVMAARRIRAAAGTNRAGDTTRVRE